MALHELNDDEKKVCYAPMDLLFIRLFILRSGDISRSGQRTLWAT